MSSEKARARVLNPLERFSEIVFGLIMVLSFTCAFSVAESGREGVREMLVGAIGCNLAWGIIDGAFYLIACLTEAGRGVTLLRKVQQSPSTSEAHRTIADALPARIAEVLSPADLSRIHEHLKGLPAPDAPARLSAEDWRGADGVFLLVFLSTFPVVLPFLFLSDARLALRISNGIAIAMLFGAGFQLASFGGLRPIRTGLAMVAIGATLVAITIALGG
jgi:hypothetical protein